MAQFKRGDFSTCDAPRSRRPQTVTTPEIIDQIHELILEDRRISAKSIAENLVISRERVGSFNHEDLDMRKFSTKWIPKCLKGDQKLQQCQTSEQLLVFCRRDPNYFLSRFVTMDKTWLCHYDPETKKKSMESRHSGSRLLKKFRVQKSVGKFLASIFWHQDGILLIDYLPKGQTINAEYYLSLLVQLKDILREKCRGKFIKGVLFFHDNAPAHRALATQKKLAYLGFHCLDYPSYCPDLVPSDYYLFPGLNKQLKVLTFLPTRRSLLPRRSSWTDNLLNFFEWLVEVRATG